MKKKKEKKCLKNPKRNCLEISLAHSYKQHKNKYIGLFLKTFVLSDFLYIFMYVYMYKICMHVHNPFSDIAVNNLIK